MGFICFEGSGVLVQGVEIECCMTRRLKNSICRVPVEWALDTKDRQNPTPTTKATAESH